MNKNVKEKFEKAVKTAGYGAYGSAKGIIGVSIGIAILKASVEVAQLVIKNSLK